MLRAGAAGLLLWTLFPVGCGPRPSTDETQATGGAGGTSSSSAKLPDGSSCAPAPEDAPGAAAAWQGFLNWHDANAAACGSTETWPSYECWTRAADPRSVPAFTACMMSNGCSSIGNSNACFANPANPAAGHQLSGAAADWYQNVCLPKSGQCGFSIDQCDIFVSTLRPELRCAIFDCIQGSCAKFTACMKAVNDRFLVCPE